MRQNGWNISFRSGWKTELRRNWGTRKLILTGT